MAYDKSYWDGKWAKSPIIYSGRTLKTSNELIGIDVKSFLTVNDSILQEVIKKYKLKKSSMNDTAWEIQKFVVKFLKYKDDEKTNKCEEYWQFPFETMQSGVGDCEDGAILIASLMINAGIPEWRVKVAAGLVQEAPTAPQGGHGYAIYLADRKDEERKVEWIISDWCYAEDSFEPFEKKPLAKNGGQSNMYKETWFTFNNEFSWSQKSLDISGRVGASTSNESQDALNSIMESIDKKL